MKAVILAGGEGTRLRPLTLALPKPVVPILGRPLLRYQIEQLRQAGIVDVILCIAYQPDRIREILGDGEALGVRLTYVVEESPLGTGGAIRNAMERLDDTTVVLNGDVLAAFDVRAAVETHRRLAAKATIVTVPVPDPCNYGLVEIGPDGLVRRFTEKPAPGQVASGANTINAGLYVLMTSALGLMPAGCNCSIERRYFPALLAQGERVVAPVHAGYWIDVGTPAKYLQAHLDLLERRYAAPIDGEASRGGWIDPSAQVDTACELAPPFFVGPGCRLAAGARLGANAVLTADVTLEAQAEVSDSVLWSGCHVAAEAQIRGALLGRNVRVEPHASVGPGAVLGLGTIVSAHSRTS